MRNNWRLIILIIVSGMVLLTNLGGQAYSLDEPETVLLARNVLKFGIPQAWDGKNLITTIDGGIDLSRIGGKWVWIWQPWLQHYTAATSILLFGDNPVGARTLFALFGVATVILIYKISEEIFDNKAVSFLVGIELVGLMPFFLYVRQVRYYAPTAFFSVLILYCLVRGLKGKWSRKIKIIFAIASGCLFFANYVAWASAMAVVGIYWWKKNSEKKYLLAVSLIELAIAAGWFLVFKPFGGNVLATSSRQGNVLLNLGIFISYINGFIFNWLMLIPIFIVRGQKAKYLYLIGIWIGTKLIIDSVFFTPHGRYVMELFPVFVLLMGFIYAWLWRKKQEVLAVGIALILTVTSFGLVRVSQIKAGKLQVRWWPEAYRTELMGKYPGEIAVLADYMKGRYKTGDVYWSDNYRFYIYETTGIPAISPWCDEKNGNLIGPGEKNPEKIKWLICFGGESKCIADFKNDSCLAKKFDFKKLSLIWPENTYAINDPDIVNRLFPPRKVYPDEVVIFENGGGKMEKGVK